MKNSIQGLFAVPVYFAMIENVEEIADEFRTVIDKLRFFDTPQAWGNPQKLTTQSFEDNVIDENNMKIIKNVIDENLKLFLSGLNLIPQKLDYRLTSWITSNDKGDYSPVHNHLKADISGVYYYQTNGEDGSIFFVTPTLAMTNSVFSKLADNFHVKPEVGKLLLFPGWLQHGVATNTSNNNRKSLAFNIYFQ